MKKYIYFFLFLCLGGIVYMWNPFRNREDKVSMPDTIFRAGDFVTINGKKFTLKGKDFFPVAVNYIAALGTDGKEMWARPSPDYSDDSLTGYMRKDSCLIALRADMQLIKQMGFNTIRVVGIGEEIADDGNKFSPVSIGVLKGHSGPENYVLKTDDDYQKYFDALSQLFKEVNDAGLKIILLIRLRYGVITTEEHMLKLAQYFRNDASIMAYDLYNEPLYFDRPDRDKKLVYKVSKRWYDSFKKKSPRQLVTIGLEGIREVFEWDPNILSVDFISLHPYEYEPEQVRNEIYWYGKYITKPWIIGETAIPADGDSVSYEMQKRFAHKTIRQTIHCGSSGYSWWQYKDVNWHKFHPSFMGLVNRTGITKTEKEGLTVSGSIKPAAEEFRYIDTTSTKDSCLCLDNYYNYTSNNKFKITGLLMDAKTGKPIEGGVILGWNEWWSHSYHTITKADGSFEMTGHYPFYHWMASATMHSMVRGDVYPYKAKTGSDGIPFVNLGMLKVKQLSY
jgi:hypothetical protein